MHHEETHGVIAHKGQTRRTDYLYRVSLKCLIRDEQGRVLVVKEAGRKTWDLPGGGMDHGEDIAAGIARELGEEVTLRGDFGYEIIAVEEPKRVQEHAFWQIRLVFAVTPAIMEFKPGEDGDELQFVDPAQFKDSEANVERKVWQYASLRQ
jgi:8-oxo-dGTP pyrophosphatase MutT (NUDIX family)